MNVTMICSTLPSGTGGGPRLNQWAIADELKQRGHNVSIIWMAQEVTDRTRYELAALGGRGIAVQGMQIQGAHPSPVSAAIGATEPDVIFGLASWTIAWASAFDRQVPRVCMIGDPEHLIHLYRRQYANRSSPLIYEELVGLHQDAINSKKVYLDILKECAATVCPVAHSVDWFRGQGLNTEYVPMPVVDPAFPGWRRREEDMPKNEKPRILLAGHLNGIATMSGLYFLAEDILPHLDVDAYDWNICGAETLTPDLATRFKPYPQIKFRGYVEDIRAEILRADISLVPTPITLGVRTRIVESMGLGACIVAHSANGVGQPEAVDAVNIALAGTGEDIAKLMGLYANHPELRQRMGHAARATFDEHFVVAKSAGRICEIMEGVA